MKLSLATALSLTALAGSAQANWFHKDPKRASRFLGQEAARAPSLSLPFSLAPDG